MKKFKFLVFVAALALLVAFGREASATYSSPGTLTSTNLLSGVAAGSVGSIDHFGYNASDIPVGTSLKALFSQDAGPSKTWYGSSGVVNAWDTLLEGNHLSGGSWISLSTLNWTGEVFYYKIMFESGGTATPILEAVRVDYSEPAPAYTPEKTMCDDSTGSGGGVVSAWTITSPDTAEARSQRLWVLTGYNGVDFPTYLKLQTMYDHANALPVPNDDPADITTSGIYKMGDLTITSSPCGSGVSAVIFVDGDLTISADFATPPDNDDNPLDFRGNCASSLAFIVCGDITISSTVGSIYGIFYAGGDIMNTESSSTRLYVFGSLLARSFALGRNLGADNSTSPAEQIIYMPKYLITLKSLLGRSGVTWKEVK